MAVKFRYSGNIYEPAAGTTVFALTSSEGEQIEYLEKDHISVSKSTDDGESWSSLSRPDKWDFSTDGRSVELKTGTEEGDWIKVKRDTPFDERYTTFQPASNLTSDQLNEGEDFSMFVDQELTDFVIERGMPLVDAPNDGTLYGRKSQAWAKVPDPGISDAPDDKSYVRKKGEWSELPPDKEGVPEAPDNGKMYGRKSKAWSEINIEGGITYKGTTDLTKAAPEAAAGDFYVNTASSGTVDDSWTGISGETLKGAERVVYSGTAWQMLPMPSGSGTVDEVVAGDDIVVDSTDPTKPKVSVKGNTFLKELKGGTAITITDGNTISVTSKSFLPYDISTLDSLP